MAYEKKSDLKSCYQSLVADLGQCNISEFPHLKKIKIVGVKTIQEHFHVHNSDYKNELTPERQRKIRNKTKNIDYARMRYVKLWINGYRKTDWFPSEFKILVLFLNSQKGYY